MSDNTQVDLIALNSGERFYTSRAGRVFDLENLPDSIRILSNGALYDHDVGRVVGLPGGGTGAFNSASARAAVLKRHEMARAAVESALIEIGGGSVTDHSVNGLERLVKSLARSALDDKNKLWERVRAIEFIMKAGGFEAGGDAVGVSGPGVGVNLSVSGDSDSLVAVLNALRAAPDDKKTGETGDIIDL